MDFQEVGQLGFVAICPDERDLVSQFRSGHLRLMRVCALRDLSLERSTRFAARLRALRDRSLGRFTRFCCVGIFGLFGTGAQVLFNLLDSCLFATIRSPCPCSFVTGSQNLMKSGVFKGGGTENR